jgi:hypothetical protein
VIQQLKDLCVQRKGNPILDLENGSLAIGMDPWALVLAEGSESDDEGEVTG